MSSNFDVSYVHPNDYAPRDAEFKAKLVHPTFDLTLYFKSGDANDPSAPISRRDGRLFPLLQVSVGSQQIVTHGSSNHVPTIDAMIDLRDNRSERIARARRRIAEATATLAALGVDA